MEEEESLNVGAFLGSGNDMFPEGNQSISFTSFVDEDKQILITTLTAEKFVFFVKIINKKDR